VEITEFVGIAKMPTISSPYTVHARQCSMNSGWAGGPMHGATQSADAPKVWGEGDWAICVDVELARQAEEFIGDGYSSLSTQVMAVGLGTDGGRLEDIMLV